MSAFTVNYVNSAGETQSEPYEDRPAAEARVATLAEEFGLDSIIFEPATETTTVTQYAVRVHNLVYDTTWLEMRTEDRGRAESWAREVGAEDFNEAVVVTREVTTTEWTEVAR